MTPFEVAVAVAPEPASREEATVDAWARYYCAIAVAAYATLHDVLTEPNPHGETEPRPSVVYMTALWVFATAAATALLTPGEQVAERLWQFTPDAGGEDGDGAALRWLAGRLDRMGINPADLHPGFDPGHFTSPSQIVPLLVRAVVREHPGWGPTKVHAELVRQGHDVALEAVLELAAAGPGPAAGREG